MEVGVDDVLHIEFKYDKKLYVSLSLEVQGHVLRWKFSSRGLELGNLARFVDIGNTIVPWSFSPVFEQPTYHSPTRFHLHERVLGQVTFKTVSLDLQLGEVSVVKREYIGVGMSVRNQTNTIHDVPLFTRLGQVMPSSSMA